MISSAGMAPASTIASAPAAVPAAATAPAAAPVMASRGTAHRLLAAMALACMTLLLALCLAPGAALAKSGTYVFDEYGLFTDDQFDSLEAQAAELAKTYNVGVYFLTTSNMGSYSPSSSERNSYAGQYYNSHSLGVGSNKDGIIFVVAVDSRDYVTWGNGLPWTDMFSQEGISAIEAAVKEQISDNRWYAGAQAYYDNVSSQLLYYSNHGKAQKPLDIVDILIRIVIVLGIPLVAAGLFVANGVSAMRTAKRRTEAHDYLLPETLVVTHASDQYLHTTHTATRRSDDDNGGGGWGGGGSSGGSGGGKF